MSHGKLRARCGSTTVLLPVSLTERAAYMTSSIPPDIKPLQPYYQDREVGFIDLFITLRNRRMLLLAAFLLIFLAAIAMVATTAPIYESRAVMQVGHIGNTSTTEIRSVSIETPAVLVERMIEEYRISDASEGPRAFPMLTGVKLNKGQPDIITITARAHTAEAAMGYLSSVVAKIKAEHAQLLQEATQHQRVRLESISQRAQQIRRQMQSLEDLINSLKNADPVRMVTLFRERGKYALELGTLEDEEAQLNLSLSRVQIQATRMLREPTTPLHPMRQRTTYLLVGFAVAVIFSIMAVFLVEFAVNVRQRLRVN